MFDARPSQSDELSHRTKAQLSQNTVDAQVDVSSSQNCRTANCKSTVKRRGSKNEVAELAETSIKNGLQLAQNIVKHTRQ